MSDRALRTLNYTESLAYATYLTRRLTKLFGEVKPSVVIGGFDSLHSGLGLAVARSLGIPWFALSFSSLPKGLSCFCDEMTPATTIAVEQRPPGELRALAERTLLEFEQGTLTAPAYTSANSASQIAKRFPTHVKTLYRVLKRSVVGRHDKFTEYSAWRLIKQYLRKRWNLYQLRKRALCQAPPTTPFVFFGLHMQPESSIDVWAPFYSDQPNVIELIARSTPPSHQVLVKLHKSDADNYSSEELDRLAQLPEVQIVMDRLGRERLLSGHHSCSPSKVRLRSRRQCSVFRSLCLASRLSLRYRRYPASEPLQTYLLKSARNLKTRPQIERP